MWQSNEQSVRTNIPQNLLLEFDPYHTILEPERSNLVPQVERLIDIGEVPLDPLINGSLLDQKPTYDLVDVFQNIYVTAQHVKLEDKSDKSVEIDFNDFFDKVESGVKIDWSNGGVATTTSMVDATISNTTRQDQAMSYQFVEKESRKETTHQKQCEDPEDLISELLYAKNIEKRLLEEMKKQNSVTRVDIPNIGINNSNSIQETDIPIRLYGTKILSPPTDIDASKSIKDTEIPTKISGIKILNPPTNIDVKLRNEATKNTPIKDASLNLTAKLNFTKLNNSLPKDNSNKPNISNIKPYGLIHNTTSFKVIAIKKDEKVFKKRCNIKPESTTCSFNKGADFNEKSIVLPQIMERILARKAFLKEKCSQPKRLLLDAGNSEVRTETKNCICSKNNGSKDTGETSKDNSFGKLNPVVLMADCNKERLKALKQSQMFKNFVMNGE